MLAVAVDLATIQGVVTVNGSSLSGASVQLYRDNGDGVFNTANDTAVTSATTNASGLYQFPRVTSASYFVLQPAQAVNGRTLPQQVSPLIPVNATAVQGQIIETIDGFNTAAQSVSDTTNDGIPVTSSIAAAQVIGGERDLFVNKTSATGSIQLSVNDPLLPDLLSFDSAQLGDGQRKISWDGVDATALTINDAGLGGIDLTRSGTAAGVRLQVGADRAGGTAIIRIYSDDNVAGTATRFSTATLNIPDTGGTPSSAEFLPFTSFVAGNGGGGAASLTSVGAIELEISGSANVNGTVELVGTIGPTVIAQNFANTESADLSLAKTVNTSTPSVGQNVTFTITVTNSGPSAATNVLVSDPLPPGLTFVSSTSSQGSYNAGTGVWTIGSIANTATANLQIVATVNVAGVSTNTAQISQSDQLDPDSTPGNSVPGEDDIASVTISPQLVDVSLTKSVDIAAPNVGQNITFTITAANAGPDTATGVVVRDVLPTGTTLVNATATQGSYNTTTGLWSVGTITVGATPSLTLVATVNSIGSRTNTAEVTATDQRDSDSTPNNNVAGEDDQASVTFDTPVADLSLTNTASSLRPNVGETFSYNIALANAGPATATGVTVADLLPAGLTFLSSTVSQGDYNATSGIWTVGTVPVGATPTLTLNVRLNNAGTVSNTARVATSNQFDPDSTPGNNVESEDDQETVTFTPARADLSLTKTTSAVSPNIGDTVTFTITANNAGPDTGTGIVIRDLVPANVLLLSSSPSAGTYDAASGLWTLGTLASAGTATLLVEVQAQSTTLVTNVAEIIAADQFDPDSTPNNNVATEDDQAVATFQAKQIDLSLTKTVDNARPKLGDQITFTITVANSGPSQATGVIVTDVLPNGLSLVRSSPSQGSFNTSSGAWNVGSLALNSTATLSLVARVDAVGSTTNTAEVTAADQADVDSTPNNHVATEDDQASVDLIVPVADLSLTKTVNNARPNIGESVTFQISLNNAGPDPATGVRVTDILPSGTAFVSTSLSAGSYDAATGLWTVGSLAVNETATLDIVAIVESAGAKTNTARVTSANEADPDSIPGNNVPTEDDQDQVTITPPQIDLSLTKSVDVNRPSRGENVDFTLTVSNAGPDDATGVAVTDLLPAGLTLVSNTASDGSYNASTGVWSVGSIAAGSNATLTLTASVESADAVTNVAEVTAANQFDIDSTPGNEVTTEDDYASVVVTPARADLSLEKTVSNAKPNVGAQVTFTLTVRNAGPDPATNVVVTDTPPAGLTFVSSNPSVGNFDVTTNRWTIPRIANGGSVTLALVTTVDTLTEKTNTAEITASNQFDPDSVPGNSVVGEDDMASVSLTPQLVDLALTKLLDEPTPNVGDNITYTLALSNAGPSDATGVQVRDSLPDGVKFVSATPSQGTYNATTGLWRVGGVANGATPKLVITATVLNVRSATNIAEVTAADQTDVDSTPDNNVTTEDDYASVTLTTLVADLSVTKTVDNASPDRGDNVTFTIDLANAGPDTATEVAVRDQLPPGLTFVSAAPSIGTYNATTGLWTIPSIASGDQAALELVATVTSGAAVTNRAEVTASRQFDPDSTPGNMVDGEDDMASVNIAPNVVDISLSASVDNDAPVEGDTIAITITTNNAGPATATGVVVSSLIPDGLTLTSANPTQGSYDPTTGIWTVGSIAANANAQLVLNAVVDVRGLKQLTAQVIATDQFDIDSTPDNNVAGEDDQVTLTIRAPRLLTKRLFLAR